MIDFGYTLQKAREAKGLTITQIAESTHMMPQQVEDLEHENFSRIAAPIYGRGFVKLYCEAVGIDPKPLVAEFMEIYNGNRKPTIRMRQPRVVETPPPPPPLPPPPPAPAPETTEEVQAAEPEVPQEPEAAEVVEETQPPQPLPPPVQVQRADTELSMPTESPSPEPLPPPVSAEEQEPQFQLEQETVPAPPSGDTYEEGGIVLGQYRGPSRYAAPTPIDNYGGWNFKVPPAAWRILVLAVVSILILWGLISLVSKVYRAATTAPVEETPSIGVEAQVLPDESELPGAPTSPERAAPTVVEPPLGPRPPRSPLPVPPLYID